MTSGQAKNIVICLDGTGNQFREENTNVVKLYRVLVRDPLVQVAYYDPGVGTIADPAYKIPLVKKIDKLLGLAFGRGLTRNLVEAYSYLMDVYSPEDRIFIFGFSRGAYTARALAAFIRAFGILDRGCQNLIPYAMKLFKAKEKDFKLMQRFKHTYGQPSDIHFLGLWDSVKTFGWVTRPIFLPYTTNNRIVKTIRHALAIDEKRVFFKPMRWGKNFMKEQDIKEVWFPGVHSDIGGGYPEEKSGLAKTTLEWMIQEALAPEIGLRIVEKKYQRYVMGEEKGSGYSGPDACAPAHESLQGGWLLVQRLPGLYRKLTGKALGSQNFLRKIPTKETIHQSVLLRSATLGYNPQNLVSDYTQTYTINHTLDRTITDQG